MVGDAANDHVDQQAGVELGRELTTRHGTADDLARLQDCLLAVRCGGRARVFRDLGIGLQMRQHAAVGAC